MSSGEPFRRGGWPAGLIGMLGLIVAVEQSVVRLDPALSNTASYNWRYAPRAASSAQVRRAEILGLGTSRIKCGILPRVITAATGRSMFNLAICNGGMPAAYFLLRRALEAGARPKAVVIDCQDGPITREHLLLNERNWPEFVNLREALDLAGTARDPEFPARLLLARLFPSSLVRYEIRRNVLAGLRGEDASSRWEMRLIRRNWRSNQGTHALHRNAEFEAGNAGESLESEPKRTPRPDFATSTLTAHYSRRFFDLAAAHRIRVFYLIPPVSSHLQAEWKRSGLDRDLVTRFALQAQAYLPGLVVIDARRAGYRAAAFWDDDHLNAEGAAVLSAEVAAVIGRELQAPSASRCWVMLPRYRSRERPPGIEDMWQSGLALRTSGAMR